MYREQMNRSMHCRCITRSSLGVYPPVTSQTTCRVDDEQSTVKMQAQTRCGCSDRVREQHSWLILRSRSNKSLVPSACFSPELNVVHVGAPRDRSGNVLQCFALFKQIGVKAHFYALQERTVSTTFGP